jgi:hypothetical protein
MCGRAGYLMGICSDYLMGLGGIYSDCLMDQGGEGSWYAACDAQKQLLSLCVDGVLELIPEGLALVIAVDDSHLRKSG